MASLRDSHGCCALICITGFTDDNYWSEGAKEQHLLEIKSAIRGAKADGRSLLLATLTNKQKEAEKLLLSQGFKAHSDSYAYRSRQTSGNSNGVKVYILTLLKKKEY